MAQIRCPHCETLHDLDDAFLAAGPRRMRCASCRTIFEAQATESDVGVTVALPLPEPNAPRGAAAPVAPEAAALEAPPEPVREAGPEAPIEVAPESADAGEDISADDLEALFADSAPAAQVETAADAEIKAAPEEGLEAEAAAPEQAAPEEGDNDEPTERRARRAGARVKPAARPAPPPPKRGRMVAAMVMAAGVGTLASLVLLRQEAVQLFPGSARVFDAIGLSTPLRGLDIAEIQSQILRENGQETLEISGRIVNKSKGSIKLPMLRLAIRAGAGNELYVWTANAEVAELGPGETTRFSRRLASPPAESHSVMVRFVAKDDIVAAIR